MKRVLLFLLLISATVHAQVHDAAFPALNAGGQINAMVEDSVNRILYIAGNFTSVGGVTRRNIAAIDLTTMVVKSSFNPISAMNGSIRCMQRYGTRLYIGGDFTSVNGNSTYRYLRRIDLSASGSTGSFNTTWSMGCNATINDMALEGTTLYYCGQGIIADDPVSGTIRQGIAALNANTGNLLPYDPTTRPANTLFTLNTSEPVKLLLSPTRLYVCGRYFGGPLNDGIIALNKSTGDHDPAFHPVFTDEQVIDAERRGNKIYVLNSRTWPFGFALMEFDEITNAMTPGALVATGGTPECIALYQNELFVAGSFSQINSQPRNYLAGVDLNTLTPSSFHPQPNSPIDHPRGLLVFRNFLYVSDNSLTQISGVTRNGSARYCMKPHNSPAISISDASICPLQTGITASISTVPYAATYQWNYSGSGISISGSGTTISMSANNHPVSGILTVTPYSSCGLPGESSSVAIQGLTAPEAFAGSDTSINCIRNEVFIQGESSTFPALYEWILPGGGLHSDSLFLASVAGQYILNVTDPLTTCHSKDTLHIVADTVKPLPLLPVGNFLLTCADSTVLLSGNSSPTWSSTYWRKQGGATFPDPFLCTSPGLYYLVATDPINGCKDSLFLSLQQDVAVPQGFLFHPNQSSFILDTLNCLDTLLHIQGGSVPGNCSFHWRNGNLNLIQNPAPIDTGGLWEMVVTDPINGCNSATSFFIYQNQAPPVYQKLYDTLILTCSYPEQLTNNLSLGSNQNAFVELDNSWVNYPVLVNESGNFNLFIVDTINYCYANESLLVIHLPLLEFAGTTDTIVCKNALFSLSPQPVNPVGTVQFSIDNLSFNTSAPVFTIENDTTILLYVSDSLCEGTYTVQINLPPEREDTIIGIGDCDGTGTGTIAISSQGGIPPFLYSLNSAYPTTHSQFLNVEFGQHTITITDGMGCATTTNYLLEPETPLPTSWFMVDTRNSNGDTIVLVNTTLPLPDSVHWHFSDSVLLASSDRWTARFIISDSLPHSIGCTSWFSGCPSTSYRILSWKNAIENEDSTWLHLSVFPNPASDHVTIRISAGPEQRIRVDILRMNGTFVHQELFLPAYTHEKTILLDGETAETLLIRAVGEISVQSKILLLNR